MGDFFKQIKIDKQKDGTVLIFERYLSPPKVTVSEIDPKLKCKGCYKAGFKTLKGLKGHEASCKATMLYDINNVRNERFKVFRQMNASNSELKTTARDRAKGYSACNNMSVILNNVGLGSGEKSNIPKIDGRKNNKGSSERQRHSIIS